MPASMPRDPDRAARQAASVAMDQLEPLLVGDDEDEFAEIAAAVEDFGRGLDGLGDVGFGDAGLEFVELAEGGLPFAAGEVVGGFVGGVHGDGERGDGFGGVLGEDAAHGGGGGEHGGEVFGVVDAFIEEGAGGVARCGSAPAHGEGVVDDDGDVDGGGGDEGGAADEWAGEGEGEEEEDADADEHEEPVVDGAAAAGAEGRFQQKLHRSPRNGYCVLPGAACGAGWGCRRGGRRGGGEPLATCGALRGMTNDEARMTNQIRMTND